MKRVREVVLERYLGLAASFRLFLSLTQGAVEMSIHFDLYRIQVKPITERIQVKPITGPRRNSLSQSSLYTDVKRLRSSALTSSSDYHTYYDSP